ncbi:hypothetical protein H4R34_000355 [Dimargaris verticillata]|uniref:Uncharacterized protein n=1 Tax=Dimargaris verticillata TaxID=2761393 RepID=A0A9W8BAI9_9FUNG|nr:hypothetical protein H4R34_000355 [Dimargaris verticillata]
MVPSTRAVGGHDEGPRYLYPPPTARSDLVYSARFIPHLDYKEALDFLIEFVHNKSREANEKCEIIGLADEVVKDEMKTFNFVWLACSKSFLPEIDRLNFVASIAVPPFIPVRLPNNQ